MYWSVKNISYKKHLNLEVEFFDGLKGDLIFNENNLYGVFEALKNEELKKEISKLYGLSNLKTFINFIRTIKFIRNICAHAGVLYDLNFPQGIYKIPRIKFNDNNNQSLDAGIKTISFILKNISEERHNEMNIEINKLFKEYENNETIKIIITDKIGYTM